MRKMFPFLVLAGAVFIVFSPCLFAEFLNYDDLMYVVKNPLLSFKDPGDVLVLFMHMDVSSRIYVPLTNLTFSVEHSLWGWTPAVFHFNNILLHVITSGLVLVLGCRLGLSVKAAFLAALVFALHPMRVESVAWIFERKDVLFGAFYVGALIMYLDYVRSGRFGWYVAALVCAILSILSKPMALSLPLILFLLDWMCARRWSRQILWEKIPFMLTLWPVAMITVMLQAEPMSWRSGEIFLITVFSSVFYVVNFFCLSGSPLIALTPQPVICLQPEYFWALVIFPMLVVTAWILRRDRWVFFAGIFYVLSIFIVWQIAKNSSIIVAERFMYVPCVGFVFLIAVTWERIFFQDGATGRRKSWLGWTVAGVLCMILATTTFQRTLLWQDSLTFWTEVVRQSPEDANAHNNRGAEFVRDPDMCRKYGLKELACYELARRDFQRAIELAPRDGNAWHNLSVALWLLDRKAEGFDAARRAGQLGWRAP